MPTAEPSRGALSRGAPSPFAVVGWLLAAGGVTLLLLPLRDRIGGAHVALAYLLVVLGASARSGRRVAWLLSVACFLAFNMLFVPPYGTLAVHDPLDWLVLLAFLVTGAVAAELLHRARAATAAAERRTAETERLAALAADALRAPRAEDAAARIAHALRDALGAARCELWLREEEDRLTLVAHDGADPGEDDTRAERAGTVAALLLDADARTLLLPLRAGERQVGFVRLASARPLDAGAATAPFPSALAQYAALGVERVRLERAAAQSEAWRESDRLKDAMLRAVSHDLRTPLTSIMATARELADAGDERGAHIRDESERLERYVGNLLDLSRLDAGRLPLALDVVPVEDLLGAVLRQLGPLATGRDVRVAVDDEGGLLLGRLDFVLAMRAIANVLENALRYTPASEPVEVRATREDGQLRVDVADLGPGVLLADRARIFEPFQRGDAGRETPGTGLGLPIARRLAEAHGGSLTLAPREGGGAVFTFRLPLATLDGSL